MEDLRKIPLTDKKEIQRYFSENTLAKGFDINKCIKTKTSGSTGVPLTIFTNQRAVDIYNAVSFRASWQMELNSDINKSSLETPDIFLKKSLFMNILGF